MAKQNTKKPLEFYQRLILNRFLLKEFGYDTFDKLAQLLKDPKLEQINEEGCTGFYIQLSQNIPQTASITKDKLAEYDLNIVTHLNTINEKRDLSIKLKYFQYLSLLFVEYYLDEYFNNRKGLLASINKFRTDFNEQYPNDAITEYTETDLNKIALWNATGSGKTLLMHINYFQYLRYAHTTIPSGATFILLTPKEGLSLQHNQEFKLSSVPAKIFNKSDSRLFSEPYEIQILENTKLGDKDGDKTVAVSRFGNQNIVFVDEGHRGSSGEKWYTYRNQLCENGFSFEYSATFGQAIKASGSDILVQEYAKCILFDYSYKYFHKDGYGKEYNIINLKKDTERQQKQLYLTACLLTFYQQKKLFQQNIQKFSFFNVEDPLFIFVGSSVNAVRTENKKEVSDVIDILNFLRSFIDEPKESLQNLARIYDSDTGLLDSKKRDIFKNSFTWIWQQQKSIEELYLDILQVVFHCSIPGAELHVANLKGVDGEISLWLGDNKNIPFGLINVGDSASLLKLCKVNKFLTTDDDFGSSLFQKVNEKDSSINILIGSKKFTEGWNCWRVSTMGLMNMGKSEGSEIIQLFGRGIRLKGANMSLKRSLAYHKDNPSAVIPSNLPLLETLNVFGVKADYMAQFKEYLNAEGVSTEEEVTVLTLPVIRNTLYKSKGLYSLRVTGNLDYKKDAPKPILQLDTAVGVIKLDCYSKVQFETSQAKTANEVVKNEGYFTKAQLALLDYDSIFFELLRYKNEKSRYNMNLSKKNMIQMLADTSWYILLIPKSELEIHSMNDVKRLERIAISLLKKYFDKQYYMLKNRWEVPLMNLVSMDDTNENFLENDEYTINIKKPDTNTDAVAFVERLQTEVEKAKQNQILSSSINSHPSGFDAMSISESLYNPLLYVAKSNFEITVSPVALNEGEFQFIKDLQTFIKVENKKDTTGFFYNKELYLIRNKSRKGIGFFEDKGFYPDFIMWLLVDEKQYLTFIDPHGMRAETLESEKVQLYKTIKANIETNLTDKNVVLNSFILSPTKHAELVVNDVSVQTWNNNHVLFMSEDVDYIAKLFEMIVKA